MTNEQWYALVEQATGRLYAQASIDLDDEDTQIDTRTSQPYSQSGLRGIAHPDKLTANGLEAKALVFNPQREPQDAPGGRYEWDENRREFVARSGRDLKARELVALEQRVAELKSELGAI